MSVLQVVRNGAVAVERPLGAQPTTLGRGAGNDLVFSEATVSWNHAVVWLEEGRVWVRDLRLTNGTFLNGRRISGPEIVGGGDVLRLGDDVHLRIAASDLRGDPARGIVVEDSAAGVSVPFTGDRFHVGSGADAHFRLADGPERVATLLRFATGEIWCGTDDGEAPVAVGVPFAVGGRELVLREVTGAHVPTEVAPADRYGYRLDVRLDGPTGPEATLHGPGGRQLEFQGGNRAILLWVLGRRHLEDAAKPPEERGWVTDDEVQSDLWGRLGDDNKLHVLLYRLRSELKRAGFDPWFVEKRHRHVRARLSAVTLG